MWSVPGGCDGVGSRVGGPGGALAVNRSAPSASRPKPWTRIGATTARLLCYLCTAVLFGAAVLGELGETYAVSYRNTVSDLVRAIARTQETRLAARHSVPRRELLTSTIGDASRECWWITRFEETDDEQERTLVHVVVACDAGWLGFGPVDIHQHPGRFSPS